MKYITVYLGSRTAHDPIYSKAVIELGKLIAKDKHALVYGGAQIGTMGLLADTCLKHGGRVIGIMPEILSDREIIHKNLSETIVVKDMSMRKQKLEEVGDIFIAMPGGAGTLDEIFEVITNAQIGLHKKAVCFMNIDGFYVGIRLYLNKALEQNFISQENYDAIYFFDSIEEFSQSKLYLSA